MLLRDAVGGPARTRAEIQFGLGIVDEKTSELVRAFGTGAPGDVKAGRNQPCVSGTGTIWAPFSGRYTIEEWREDGLHRLRVLHRPLPSWWWGGDDASRSEAMRWGSRIRDCAVDSGGRLWILSDMPREDATVPTTPDGRIRQGILDSMAVSVIDVIDPERGVVLASQRFPRVFAGFLRDGRAYHKSEDARGETWIEIWELALREGQ